MNFPKEDDCAEEVFDYDSCRLKIPAQSIMRTSDTRAQTYRSSLEQETTHILDRVKKLKDHLEIIRSPLRNKNNESIHFA